MGKSPQSSLAPHNDLHPSGAEGTGQVREDGASTDTASLLCITSRVCNWKQGNASAFPLILPLSRLLALHNYLCAGRGKSKMIKASPAAESQICCRSGALPGNPTRSPLPQAPLSPASVSRNPQINKATLGLECECAQDSIDPSHRRQQSL